MKVAASVGLIVCVVLWSVGVYQLAQRHSRAIVKGHPTVWYNGLGEPVTPVPVGPPIDAVEFWPFVTDQQIADKIARALGNDPNAILEIRKQSDGSFRAVIDPEKVKQVVLKVLEEK